MKKKVLYVDMDNTLVDYDAGLAQLPASVWEEYRGREDKMDEIDGLFETLPPMPGGIEAFHELAELFEVYILSTAPWLNPSAWRHKLEWVQRHLGVADGTPAYKRLILSHHKLLNHGAFLVDDREHGDPDDRPWQLLQFGSAEFPDWASVLEYLRPRAT